MKSIPILFKYKDLQDLYPSQNGYNSLLKRSLKKGSIKQVKKGLYALVDPSTGGIYASRFQIASNLFDDAYFSYHEALEHYGLVNQVFISKFIYLTHVYVRDIIFESVSYCSRKNMCELEILDYMENENIRVVSLERAIVDCIDNPKYAGGLEEIEKALDVCRELNLEKVKRMLEYYDKSFLYQKVGYLFEKHFGNKVPNWFFDLCQSKSSSKVQYFEAKVGFAKLVSKWKLMVPKERILPDDIF